MAIPKKAVKPLIEHCNRVGDRTGRSGAVVMQGYLKLIKNYAGYFFSDNWPAKPVVHVDFLWLEPDEDEFLSSCRGYRDEVERFTLILLKRNICLEGFDAEHFDFDFDFYGRILCRDCVVRDAMHARWYLRRLDEVEAETREQLQRDPKDPILVESLAIRSLPENAKLEKMKRVELGFYELEGGAEGKSCDVWNKCLCPFGAKSRELGEFGSVVRYLLKIVQYYDFHWNAKRGCDVGRGNMEWYHFEEEGFLDVTSREDILKALEDGRIKRIDDERKRYEEWCRSN